jgi:uncharacterized membrane protein YhaH (DUF805 family)
VFSGRARRREFWMFTLVDVLLSIVIEVVDWLLGTDNVLLDTGALSWVYGLAIIVPTVAVTARRLHDIDRTAWWLLLAFVPVVGWIVLLVFCVTAGSEGRRTGRVRFPGLTADRRRRRRCRAQRRPGAGMWDRRFGIRTGSGTMLGSSPSSEETPSCPH